MILGAARLDPDAPGARTALAGRIADLSGVTVEVRALADDHALVVPVHREAVGHVAAAIEGCDDAHVVMADEQGAILVSLRSPVDREREERP